MTEAEWLECADPEPMLEFLRGKESDRKLRLFACACCRRLWTMMVDGSRSCAAVEAAERFADGSCSEGELRAARAGANRSVTEWEQWVPYESADLGSLEAARAAVEATEVGWLRKQRAAWHAATATAARAEQAAWTSPWELPEAAEADWKKLPSGLLRQEAARGGERVAQASLLRDIFGNPFRPVAIHPAWRTPTVVSLAQAAYDERILPTGTLEPARLAILADALEEAGCYSADLLNHLRRPGDHVRGCFALDAVLGKQ
jgi:hypothetical protein